MKTEFITKFKKGDWVSCLAERTSIAYFACLYQVTNVLLREGKEPYYEVNNNSTMMYTGRGLNLICGFVRGERIEVYMGESLPPQELIFLQYRPELLNPFECVARNFDTYFENDRLYKTSTFKYARKLSVPTFKPYTEFLLEWIGEIVVEKSTGNFFTIKNIGLNYKGDSLIALLIGEHTNTSCNLLGLFKNFTWEYGLICGNRVHKSDE